MRQEDVIPVATCCSVIWILITLGASQEMRDRKILQPRAGMTLRKKRLYTVARIAASFVSPFVLLFIALCYIGRRLKKSFNVWLAKNWYEDSVSVDAPIEQAPLALDEPAAPLGKWMDNADKAVDMQIERWR